MTQKINMIERLKKIRIFSYLRELSVVIIGVLITLAITDRVNTNSKQREIREALHLIELELRNNLQILEGVSKEYDEDIKLIKLFRDNLEDIRVIPAEILIENPNVFGRMLEFIPTKDAYEVLKSSALMQYIKDKSLLLELMSCYSEMDKVTKGVALYTDMKIDATEEFRKIDSGLLYRLSYMSEAEENPYPYFETVLEYNEVRNFLNYGPNIFGYDMFGSMKQAMEGMIERINKE